MNQTVIDFHTHPYLSGEEFLNFYPERFTPDPVQCRTDLERAGISKICGSVILKKPYRGEEGFAQIRRCNQRAIELRELLGGFYVPGFHVHPDFVEESIAEIEEMHARGVRLIGELVPYLHGWSEPGPVKNPGRGREIPHGGELPHYGGGAGRDDPHGAGAPGRDLRGGASQ